MNIYRRTLIVITLLILTLPAKALEFLPGQGEHSDLVSYLVTEKLKPLIVGLPLSEQRQLADVKIRLTTMKGHAMALSLAGKQPRILLNRKFISTLDSYAEAYLISRYTGRTHLPEAYLNEFFWSQHPFYEGPDIQSALDWSGIGLTDVARFNKDKRQLMEAALLDILLHEMGHHSRQAFYNFRASTYTKQANETKADNWALDKFAEYFPEAEGVGRLLIIGLIFERDRWSALAEDHSYPRLLPWVEAHLQGICEDAVSNQLRQDCQRLDNAISLYFSPEAEGEYRKRLDSGEHYASYPLGQILLSQNSFVDACTHFKESLTVGQVSRAAVYVGWCYQNGYLQPDAPDSQVLALAQFRQALQSGYGDARDHLRSMRDKR